MTTLSQRVAVECVHFFSGSSEVSTLNTQQTYTCVSDHVEPSTGGEEKGVGGLGGGVEEVIQVQMQRRDILINDYKAINRREREE